MRRTLREGIRERPVALGLVSLTALALCIRLLFLGVRIAHWDEARVALRILEYGQTGNWEYDPGVHGPFLFHVNTVLFDWFGRSDFVMRLPVAIVGGLLPLSAWLFRDRLRDTEVLALGGLFALNPVLLYYSRFMRNDVLVATFAVVAFGCFLRAADTRSPGALYAGVGSLALAFTTKENVLVYLACWVGAAALVIDYRVFLTRSRDTGLLEQALETLSDALRTLWNWRTAIILSIVEFFVIISFFYAPRPALFEAVSDLSMVRPVLEDATLGAYNAFERRWATPGARDHPFLSFFTDYLDVLAAGAFLVVVFAPFGFLLDRYSTAGQRDLVAFTTYWGVASIPLYPIVTDISAPWSAVHAVVALAFPAAVGVGAIVEFGLEQYRRQNLWTAWVASAVVILCVVQVGGAAYHTSFAAPQDEGELVQFGQPDDGMREMVSTVRAVSAQQAGPTVVYYGQHFEPVLYRNPLPWYFQRDGITTSHSDSPHRVADQNAPVVVAPAGPGISGGDADLNGSLGEYDRLGAYPLTLRVSGNTVYAVVYVEKDALETVRSSGS